MAQQFNSGNKGRHHEIVERLKSVPDVQAGKSFVKASLAKKDCAPGLLAFLNEV
jgi:hypothetical protein